ncbi:hypothetical protein ALP79_200383 [Pseudomonas savastanoi pv. fraxini]|nr:hypothetical protein [Pseudomonas savastanoi]KUG43780.1 hypothetical protein ALP79_200383 [Pseudomonas savastanoi pv. fraxini]RMR65537.1 hypothetical protein ALP81_02843 [Pseudomonas savastanoi pv. fraxini]RMR67111.1 hypothetical protein ALP80_200170 [Pseudomonas savastanoi pv. fraxini]RMT82346.1 hypothetical protein ALP41_03676 [Pseudomonas savastanoi pv. nerii]
MTFKAADGTRCLKVKILFFCVFVFGFSKGALASVDDGVDAYNRGLYEQAFSIFQSEGAKGDVTASYYLGRQYEEGKGVRKNPVKAFESMLAAASRGMALAQYKVGVFF